jgi:hypothetical protein
MGGVPSAKDLEGLQTFSENIGLDTGKFMRYAIDFDPSQL